MSSFYVCNTAALQSNLSKTSFKVYSFIAMSANNKTGESYKSKRTIAQACKISPSSVVRATKELCNAGLLQIKARYWRNGKQTSNLYILLSDVQTKLASTKPTDDTSFQCESICPKNIETPQKRSQDKLCLFKCSPSAFMSGISANELKIFTYLTLRTGKSNACFPSKKEIATDCATSLSTVFRAIKKLCKSDLLQIEPQTRKKTYGNNGTSANLYILTDDVHNPKPLKNLHKPTRNVQNRIKILLYFILLANLTPYPRSSVTPHRTTFITKVTLKQRKDHFISKLTKWYRLHKHKKIAGRYFQPAKLNDS